MSAMEITDRLNSALDRQGYRSVIVSATHAGELRENIKDNIATGRIGKELYRRYANYFDGMLNQDIPSWARSIIVIAAPVPKLEVWFTINGERKSTIIPPTYEHSGTARIIYAIERELKPFDYQIRRAELPVKLLAARSGLARYGRNNIAYVEGMGSFLRLLAFYSDLPCAEDWWQQPQAPDECANCKVCINACPSGAIDPDQFQLPAEQCLTCHNESPEPFPSWVEESWHHCLIGCMKCQDSCPLNKDCRSWTEQFAEFTEEETAALLRGVNSNQLPASVIAKFSDTGLLDDTVGLARNLRCVLGRGPRAIL